MRRRTTRTWVRSSATISPGTSWQLRTLWDLGKAWRSHRDAVDWSPGMVTAFRLARRLTSASERLGLQPAVTTSAVPWKMQLVPVACVLMVMLITLALAPEPSPS
jgi:hypothetical protein